MSSADRDIIAGLLDGLDIRSAGFIVTVYGDVVVPRGGVLWTGTLIAICGEVGINESLVRTAVSRLVAAHRLTGERAGRRSYYRLDASARQEFDAAAALLYAEDKPARGWQILHAPAMTPEAARGLRLGHMGGPVWIRPDRGRPAPEGATCFPAADPPVLGEVAQFWDLSDLDLRYRDLLARFGDLAGIAPDGGLADLTALVARLLLVHVYRGVMLRDPRLPQGALPPGWKGQEARALFRGLYAALTPQAERYVAAHFEGVGGLLPARTQQTEARLAGVLAS
ncbi:PaaX family transcriptional regulator C-terminal domain-containing protein [uncultured Paracoccus sp.]|uniref:PaaX family transcriptional regulator C-terminal domain-containing protein n=1 Tax=uncultured Paracoccus sp. TaxID=189685 RepID=UPI00260D8B92|nr:PaaX family transcriptional regulator C-terminal domain-containing protein [uncultured Paracoccus sp.]